MPVDLKKDLGFLPGEILEHSDEGISLLPADPLSPEAPIPGQLFLTNSKLVFRARGSNQYISVPLGTVSRIEKMGGQSTKKENAYGLEIHCKDMRVLRIAYPAENHSRRELGDRLHALAFGPKAGTQPFFAFRHGQAGRTAAADAAWRMYNFREEMRRQGVPNLQWRISELNANYEVSPTYPALIAVPSSLSDEDVIEGSKFRSKNRLQALSWIHPYNKATITRCSQPRVGMVGKRSQADEKVMKAIRAANPTVSSKMCILDARPKANAVANKAKGFGYESSSAYPAAPLTFLDIHNIHVMRNSLKSVYDMCYPAFNEEHWPQLLEGSDWLKHVKLVLVGAVRVAELIAGGTSVLVHCSDGWDRTAQLSGLAMLLLDPYYRTRVGFQILIEKEWLSFGHKFGQRIGHGSSKHDDQERSPIFVQFVDCTWQVMRRFPRAFEFNETFLITVLDHLYSCTYGNFLYNCERERMVPSEKFAEAGAGDEAGSSSADPTGEGKMMGNVPELSRSVWEMTHREAKRFTNPMFDPTSQPDVLDYMPTLRQIELWTGYYGRWSSGPSSNTAVLDKMVVSAKADVAQLEAEVAALEQQCTALGVDGAIDGRRASTGQRIIKVEVVSDL